VGAVGFAQNEVGEKGWSGWKPNDGDRECSVIKSSGQDDVRVKHIGKALQSKLIRLQG
jgi:hypothetical protein